MYIEAKEVVPCDVVYSINSGPLSYLAAMLSAMLYDDERAVTSLHACI